MSKPKPRIKYNIDTRLWECCDGNLHNLGVGVTRDEAYKMWWCNTTTENIKKTWDKLVKERNNGNTK